MPSSGDNKALRTDRAEENKWALPFATCLKGLATWLQALEFLLIFSHSCAQTHNLTHLYPQKGQQEYLYFSPLSQHNNFGLSLTPFAEGEELVDNASCFAQELLGAELQLFVALENGRLRFPEILNGRCVQSIECRKPSNKVLELIWKTEDRQDSLVCVGKKWMVPVWLCLTDLNAFSLYLANLVKSKWENQFAESM